MLLKYYRPRYKIKKIFLIIAMVLCMITLLFLYKEKHTPDGSITFILDLSHSMNTKDVEGRGGKQISRLLAAKKYIKHSISQQQEPRTRGLIVFSQQASYILAPTQDTETFIHYIDTLHTNQVPVGGSNLSGAIKLFEKTSSDKDIGVLLTDGGDENVRMNISVPTTNPHLSIVGIGSEEGGTVFYPDDTILTQDGKPVHSKRSDQILTQLAETYETDYHIIEAEEDIKGVGLISSPLIQEKQLQRRYVLLAFIVILAI